MSTLYKDRPVEITDQEVIFRHYHLPFGNDRHVSVNQIERFQARPSSFWGGSWRIWGSGELQTWFPLDGTRRSRDRIFMNLLRGRSRRIGFTVERSSEAAKVLKDVGLLQETLPA